MPPDGRRRRSACDELGVRRRRRRRPTWPSASAATARCCARSSCSTARPCRPRRQRRPARLPHRGRARRPDAARSSASSPATYEHRGADAARRSSSIRVGDVAPGTWRALNEAVVEKRGAGHTVRLLVRIDGAPFTTLRRRRADRGHADRLDRLLALGPGPDRVAHATGPCCSPRCRRTCCSTARSCSTPTSRRDRGRSAHRSADLVRRRAARRRRSPRATS